MSDTAVFGRHIKQMRKERDLTQEDFAERVGCSIETISKIERGERRPSRQIAERMAQVLDLPAEERESFVRAARMIPAESAQPVQPAPPKISTGETDGLGVSAPHKPQIILPSPPTLLVGRDAELADLETMIADRFCRLITLTGPGGIGKTRLGIEMAMRRAAAFQDGVTFVPLAAVGEVEMLAAAIGEALGLGAYGADDAAARLLDYLRDRSLLLVLDNFEHLVEGADLLVDMLQRAPNVKLIVTSRERLNIQGEWVFELRGLDLPRNEQSADFAQAGAVALFLQAARRARSGFILDQDSRSCIAEICRLVEGMPLAIELAAAWVRVLPCNEIAAEIERTIDFLAASARDLPTRHRSLRAVFEHSWNLLSADERAVLVSLSVFRGGFRREAAEWVAGATLPLLTALVDKSLLRRNDAGRYDIHELIRQYAGAQLAADLAEYNAVRERHSTYYLTLVQNREKTLKRARERAVISELAIEIDNLRQSWDWAIEHSRTTEIRRAIRGLSWFYELRCWFAEGESIMRRAVEELQHHPSTSSGEHTLVVAQLMTYEAWFCFRQGRIGVARERLERAVEQLRGCDDRAALADALAILGWATNHLGHYHAARNYLLEALDLARAVGEPWMIILSLGGLGIIAQDLGELEQAERLCREGLEVALELGSVRAVAFSISALSSATIARAEWQETEALLRASFATSSAIGDYWGIGSALTQLGVVAFLRAEYSEAQYLFREALSTFRDIGDRWSLARTLDLLGATNAALGEETGAWQAYGDAWRLATDAGVVPVALDALLGMATLVFRRGDVSLANEAVEYVSAHPAATSGARKRAAILREQFGNTPIVPERSYSAMIEALLDYLE